MKIQANTMRGGMVIEHQGKQWTVLKIQLLQPGKGGAFIQVEMRDVATGTKSQDRWRTADTVERLEVRELDCQYLFRDGDIFTFMDSTTFDQFNVPGELLGEKAAFLQDNMEVSVNFIEGKAVAVNLPQQVTLKITEADPARGTCDPPRDRAESNTRNPAAASGRSPIIRRSTIIRFSSCAPTMTP